MGVKLYPHPDLAARGGIPVEGETFEAADADRLVGQGLAVRRPRRLPNESRAKRRARADPGLTNRGSAPRPASGQEG